MLRGHPAHPESIEGDRPVDEVRFDALARVHGSLADRRTTARAVVGGALGALGLATGFESQAKKKKKKCKKPKVKCGQKCCAKGQKCLAGKCAVPCTFSTVGSVMTLQANCTTTSTIDIPNGVTLDGDGKTVTLAGPASAAAIRALGGVANVENLTVDGSGQTGPCAGPSDAVVFGNTSGRIANVTVRRIHCGSGITVAVGQGAQGPHTGDVEDVTVEDVNHDAGNQVAAIAFFANVTGPRLMGGVSGSTIENIFEGVLLQGNVGVTVEDNDIAAISAGIHATDGADATATDNTVTGAQFGMGADLGSAATGPSTLAASGNVIVGPGLITGPTYGVAFFAGNEGNATGNTVSNFFDSAGTEACGIFVAEDAGAVTLGANAFPDPPGNEQDVCDNRP
jgi:hypothetical protein